MNTNYMTDDANRTLVIDTEKTMDLILKIKRVLRPFLKRQNWGNKLAASLVALSLFY